MNPERFRRVDDLYHSALQRHPLERSQFLIEACGADEDLRREVESLLAHDSKAGQFMETPAIELEAAAFARTESLQPLALTAGTKLGPYEILSAIGAGGMGEVYKARDTRLNRTVAIKVLPPHFSGNPERKARFEREAQTIAGLNHPHICVLHDVGHQEGTAYLVMEYLEGQTLAQRLKKGALPVDEALKIAIEIADALDKAHRQGVVHRDLKPSNVMLTRSGAKLLDFGLAKLKQGAHPPFPTLPAITDVTVKGTILGTLQYMSPEQLEGKETDMRSDIFAFGAMVYEILTGCKAFEGRSQSSLIAAIMRVDPVGMAELQPMTPPMLAHLVRRCLAKNPDERWQTSSDLHQELRWLAAGDSLAREIAPRRTRRASILSVVMTAFFVLTTVALAVVALYESRSSGNAAVSRFFIFPPDKGSFGSGAAAVAAAVGSISPDGTKLAFTAADRSGVALLWVRPVESLMAHPIVGTDGAYLPFWSPDGRWIAFFAAGKLRKVDITHGPPETLCNAPQGRGGAWNRDGVIVFAPNITGPLSRVPATGGEPAPVTKTGPMEVNHQFPSFLPDGRHFVFFIQGTNPGIYWSSLDSAESTESRLILATDMGGVYAAPGYLLFVREGTLLAQPFSASTLRLEGDPLPIGDKIGSDFANTPGFSVSSNGVLAYRMGLATQGLQIAWYDRSGRSLETVGTPGNYRGIDVSPDGKRIAVHRHDGTGGDIWLIDSALGPTSRFTFDPSKDNSSPIWSPDGSGIAFASLRSGKWGIYLKAADFTGKEELLLETSATTIPVSWSPDGRSLVYATQNQSRDMFVLSLDGKRRAEPVVASEFDENHGQVSPDGKWIAYQSNETGQFEIYVSSFPNARRKRQISDGGGIWPRWRHDGRELFYVDRNISGKLMAAAVKAANATLELSSPKTLFDFNANGALPHTFLYHPFAVSADGQRFLIPRPASVSAEETASPIVVVLNWTASLKKK